MDNKKTYNRARKILEIAAEMAKEYPGWQVANHIEEIQLHSEYAEPGYDTPACGVIATGNWNDITKWNDTFRKHEITCDLPSRILGLFEKLGINCEWSDEWSTCSDCGKLVRTSPDSYSWTASYTVGNAELLCHECLAEDPEEHLKSLEGQSNRANTITDIDPEDYGYVKVNDEPYETGWHPGQTDDP